MKHAATIGFVAAILAASLPAAYAAGKVSPETIKGATTVDGAKAKELFDKGVTFVDTRSDKDWNAGHVPGAKHIDVEKPGFTAAALEKLAKKDKEVVFYCNGVSCPRSSIATEKAVEWGYSKIYYYRLGFPDWKGAGYPVE